MVDAVQVKPLVYLESPARYSKHRFADAFEGRPFAIRANKTVQRALVVPTPAQMQNGNSRTNKVTHCTTGKGGYGFDRRIPPGKTLIEVEMDIFVAEKLP